MYKSKSISSWKQFYFNCVYLLLIANNQRTDSGKYKTDRFYKLQKNTITKFEYIYANSAYKHNSIQQVCILRTFHRQNRTSDKFLESNFSKTYLQKH